MMDANQKLLAQAFMKLDQPEEKTQCQFIWIDGSLRSLRCKSRTCSSNIKNIQELEPMEFCGSATDFDVGNLADFYAHPVKFYRDPFRCGNNILVFCETRTREGLPTFANNRSRLLATRKKFEGGLNEYFFQQPYTFLRKDGKPLSYMNPAYSPDSKSGFICGRDIAEAHYRACLYSGINLTSLEPLSNAGQWKYSIGPCSSVTVGDDVWMSRFILIRVAEDFGVTVSFETPPTSTFLQRLFAGVGFSTDSIMQHERQRIVDGLLSKFVYREENPLKIVSLQKEVLLTHINAAVDPYSIITKIVDIVAENR